jgi:hypothetical protein
MASPVWVRDRAGLVALVLILLAAALSLAHALWIAAVNDDAGIALAYARSLATGEGLRLTPLSPRVEAYSDPLWVLWLSVGYVLKLDGPSFARVSGATFAAFATAVAGFVPSRGLGRALRPLDALAPWVLAVDTTYCYWAGAGLETGAFALALTVALASGAALPAGLLGVLRPEGPLYLAGLALTRVTTSGHGIRVARWLGVAAIPWLLWLAFRRFYYGQWLPNSFFAKRSWDYDGAHYLAEWFLSAPWHWALCVAPLALLDRRTRGAAMPALAACAAAVAFILVSRGDWMAEHRFVAHALPAAAIAAGLVPTLLDRSSAAEASCGVLVLAAAVLFSPSRSLARKSDPVHPLAYVVRQARVFRSEADALGLVHPRIAHFDVGGLALESGGEVIDLAGLGDLYIGRVGYKAEQRVRDYVFDEVEPDMINLHGPCAYIRADPRLDRYYPFAGSSVWGDDWVRKDDRCPDGLPTVEDLEARPPREVRALWLCARARSASDKLPDVRALAERLARDGLRRGDRDALDAAVALDPTLTRAQQRLLEMRLAEGR